MSKSSKKKGRTTRASTKAATEVPTTSVEQSVLNNAEILSCIVQFLKEPDLRRRVMTSYKTSDWPVDPPPIQNGLLVPLLTVNKAFFHASAEVLWERMDSLIPFFGYVLPSDRSADGTVHLNLRYQNRGVATKDWDRFEFYASKTKYLSLNPKCAISPAWLAFLVNSTGRPRLLFPTLRHVVARSSDPLCLFVASNVAQVVKTFELDLDDSTTDARALTVGLTQDPSALTCLKLVCTTSPSIIEDISRITSLQSLHLTVDHTPDSLKLSPLINLPALDTLHIAQVIDRFSVTIAARFPPIVDLQTLVSQKTKMRHLKEVSIKANGTTQYRIASELLPRSLKAVKMEVISDIMNTQMLLIPLAAALYAHRNPSLARFDISLSDDVYVPGTARPPHLRPYRDDNIFNIEPFIDGLSKLRNLESLSIWRIPFLAVDVSLRLVDVIQALPRLKSLRLMPKSITNLSADALVMPALHCLEEISRQNTDLVVLQMPVDIETIPIVPSEQVSQSNLRTIALSARTESYGGLTTKQKFQLVQYLDALFPRANLEICDIDREAAEFWKFIEESLSFYRSGPARRVQ
ncbi:hypothetical protein NMY22_g838 [Coprinellus aureogranulatus]|nr:hypothetical protein NMY22_g838 [Coprinellus aureogranulatus]